MLGYVLDKRRVGIGGSKGVPAVALFGGLADWRQYFCEVEVPRTWQVERRVGPSTVLSAGCLSFPVATSQHS